MDHAHQTRFRSDHTRAAVPRLPAEWILVAYSCKVQESCRMLHKAGMDIRQARLPSTGVRLSRRAADRYAGTFIGGATLESIADLQPG